MAYLIPFCCNTPMASAVDHDEFVCTFCKMTVSGQAAWDHYRKTGEPLKITTERQRMRELIDRVKDRANSAPTCCGMAMQMNKHANALRCVRCGMSPEEQMHRMMVAPGHRVESCIGCGKRATLKCQDGGDPPWLCDACENATPTVRMYESMLNVKSNMYCIGGIKIKSDPSIPVGVIRWEIDPLDVKYDGVPLGRLLERDRCKRQEDESTPWRSFVNPTPAQRDAISAHWSAELRAKIAASKERDKHQVMMQIDADDL